MADDIIYQYAAPSALEKTDKGEQLFLAQYSEVQKKEAACFFWGRLTQPQITARCLVTLSNVVKSSFSLSPADLAAMKDPIVTAGNDTLRFEGFSHCAGVYARVDVLPGGHDGEFPEAGTTNVDFNQPMLSALGNIKQGEDVLLSVGKTQVALHSGGGKVVERKVPLPVKWIKGLTNVQLYMAAAEKAFTFTRVQALQLFQTLPNGKPKDDFYLIIRGGRPVFSPVRAGAGICVGGVQRLKLIETLLPHINQLCIFPHPGMQSTTWQLYFGDVRFSLTLSRDAWRGFSGEGAALEHLLDDIPEEWLQLADKYSYANQAFNATLFAVNEGINLTTADNLTGRLSAMGLLGFDVDDNHFFYRRLPFKMSRILTLNPRLKDAEKLLAEGKVDIISHTGAKTEATVEGSGVRHTVIITGGTAKCTCTWFSKNQGERGACKHILAVKKKTGNAND